MAGTVDGVLEIATRKKIGDENILILTSMVDALEQAKANKEELQKKLAEASQLVEKLEKTDIPDFMFELGLDMAGLLNGRKVEVKPFYYARIPALDEEKPEQNARREAALKWLRDNNHGGIIKESIVIHPEEENAQLIVDFLKDISAAYQEKSGVNYKTLEKWYREVTEQGVEVPAPLFSAFVGRRAVVK